MCGWIKTHRSLLDHWLSEQPDKLGWWVLLLLKASYEDKKVMVGNQLIELKRGQIIASNSFLAELWKTSESTALRFLNLLERDEMVNRCTNRKITILTICNYDSYQGGELKERTDDETMVNRWRTDDEPMVNRNKEIKEDKEINNITNNSACAYTREENVGWVESVERGFVERYKAQGCPMAAARATGKKAQEILQLLEVYSATREAKGRGHRDFEEFRNLFLWHVQNDKISIPVARAEKSSPKVIGNAELRKMMEESGWQS